MKLAVFDLDGTLIDSRRDLAESANELLVECGGHPLAEETVGRLVGDGARLLIARVFAEANCVLPADGLARFLAVYNGRLLRFTRPYPGIMKALETLASRATLGLLTNKPLDSTRRILEGLDLARFFPREYVRGGDGPLPRKPDPAGLLQIAADANVRPSETALVGDSMIDWQTAKAAGTRICLVRYGFGFDGFPVDRLESLDLIVDHASELPQRL